MSLRFIISSHSLVPLVNTDVSFSLNDNVLTIFPFRVGEGKKLISHISLCGVRILLSSMLHFFTTLAILSDNTENRPNVFPATNDPQFGLRLSLITPPSFFKIKYNSKEIGISSGCTVQSINL